jgi:hypothetical protein
MEDMTIPLIKLRQKTVEPKIYSLVVKANRVAILHVGVYYSLDEAFGAIKVRAMAETKTIDPSKLTLDLLMWEVMPAVGILNRLFDEQPPEQALLPAEIEAIPQATISTSEYVKQVYNMKNELMQRIIDSKDVVALAKAKGILSKTEIKLVRNKIASKLD